MVTLSNAVLANLEARGQFFSKLAYRAVTLLMPSCVQCFSLSDCAFAKASIFVKTAHVPTCFLLDVYQSVKRGYSNYQRCGLNFFTYWRSIADNICTEWVSCITELNLADIYLMLCTKGLSFMVR